MLNPSIYKFLLELRENNNRDWFQENRDLYNTAKKDFETFVGLLIEKTRPFAPELSGLQAKDCIFRIFRDVRFSNDKRPYKSNFGAFLVPGGRKSASAGYYLHVEPGQSFVGGGVYMPASPVLKAIRQEIYQAPEEFKAIIGDRQFKNHYPELYDEKLKTAPKGFPKDFADLELIKYKHYTVMKPLSDDEIMAPGLLEKVATSFEVMQPFNRYLNHIIEDVG